MFKEFEFFFKLSVQKFEELFSFIRLSGKYSSDSPLLSKIKLTPLKCKPR